MDAPKCAPMTAIAEKSPVMARLAPWAIDPADGPPEWIMWMPAGNHSIRARQGQRSITATVRVDRDTAATAAQALREHQAAGKQRPYLDFDHDHTAASAWPCEFAWRDGAAPGVYCRVQWSADGAQAVAGRSYRAFSPSFYLEEEKVTGAPFVMGGLVNDPAFRDIEPLWAARAADDNANPNPHPMPDTKDVELAAKQAEIDRLKTECAALKADALDTETTQALEAKTAELAAAQRKVAELEDAAASRAKRDADAIVASAVARGVLPPKDDAAQTRWRDLIVADPKNGELLNGMAARVPIAAQRMTRQRIEITSSDVGDVLRAYSASRDPRERGRLYRKELDPILAKGDRIAFERVPIDATNTLGTLVGNIISQRTLATLVSMRPMLLDVVSDFSDEAARLNQAVYSRAVGLPTVQNFGSAASETADVDYPVTLSAHKEVLFSFTAAEYTGTGRNLVAEHSNALAVALGNHLVDTVAALITDAFTSETTGAAATKSFSDITAAAKALNSAGAPDYDRFGWVNSDFAEALSNDEVLMEYFSGDNGSAYSRWNNVKGFGRITEFPALPANSVNLIGFFGQRNALLLATRIAVNPAELIGAGYPGVLQVVTDPVTGLSVVQNNWIDSSTLAINTRLILLYGCARGLVGAGHKFVTS